MTRLLLLLGLLLFTATANAQVYDVYANNGTYLGNTGNQYNANSINNPYGQYGSPYSAQSVNNPYSTYGSPYSATSPNNPYAPSGAMVQRGTGYRKSFGGNGW